VDRRHHDARFDGDQVDTDERDAYPGIDDDALVEHAVEDVDEAASALCPFNRHRSIPLGTSPFPSLRPSTARVRLGGQCRDASLEAPDLLPQCTILIGEPIA